MSVFDNKRKKEADAVGANTVMQVGLAASMASMLSACGGGGGGGAGTDTGSGTGTGTGTGTSTGSALSADVSLRLLDYGQTIVSSLENVRDESSTSISADEYIISKFEFIKDENKDGKLNDTDPVVLTSNLKSGFALFTEEDDTQNSLDDGIFSKVTISYQNKDYVFVSAVFDNQKWGHDQNFYYNEGTDNAIPAKIDNKEIVRITNSTDETWNELPFIELPFNKLKELDKLPEPIDGTIQLYYGNNPTSGKIILSNEHGLEAGKYLFPRYDISANGELFGFPDSMPAVGVSGGRFQILKGSDNNPDTYDTFGGVAYEWFTSVDDVIGDDDDKKIDNETNYYLNTNSVNIGEYAYLKVTYVSDLGLQKEATSDIFYRGGAYNFQDYWQKMMKLGLSQGGFVYSDFDENVHAPQATGFDLVYGSSPTSTDGTTSPDNLPVEKDHFLLPDFEETGDLMGHINGINDSTQPGLFIQDGKLWNSFPAVDPGNYSADNYTYKWYEDDGDGEVDTTNDAQITLWNRQTAEYYINTNFITPGTSVYLEVDYGGTLKAYSKLYHSESDFYTDQLVVLIDGKSSYFDRNSSDFVKDHYSIKITDALQKVLSTLESDTLLSMISPDDSDNLNSWNFTLIGEDGAVFSQSHKPYLSDGSVGGEVKISGSGKDAILEYYPVMTVASTRVETITLQLSKTFNEKNFMDEIDIQFWLGDFADTEPYFF